MRDGRPDPDELLRAVQSTEGKRGSLKVFLGASAGVGKTYAMLSEAHEQRKRGVDVVIAYVECHKRAETEALVEGLELLPMMEIEHRGSKQMEVDVDTVLARRPQLVLVDELAHTNSPGSRHTKRWQDIEDILDAGIDVYTAMNVQHLESLNDVVAQVTAVKVQETVPDAFLDQANEIELIDIPPAELRKRLAEGKIYSQDRIPHALDGFFKTSNLTALRELALRRTADTVDAEMQRLRVQEGVRQPWATRERIVVCIAPNQMATRVIRAAARLGAASHAELIALYVESDRQASRTPAEHAQAQEALELGKELGMEVVNLQGHDIVGEVMNFAQRRNATLIVVGKPIRARWKEVLFGSVVDELVRASGDIDVHVITASPEEQAPRKRAPDVEQHVSPAGLAVVMGSALLATGIGFALFQEFGVVNVAMMFLLFVAISATKCSRTESIIAATINVLCFNFFFIEPRFTFAVSDVRYLLAFGVMLTVGLVVSTLTHRLRAQLRASSDRERRTAALYALSTQLAKGRGKRDLARAAATEIRGVFDADVAIFVQDAGKSVNIGASVTGFEQMPNELAVTAWVASHGVPAGLGTDTLPGASALYLPLKGAEKTIGVLAFKPNRTIRDIGQRQLLDTFANGLGLALERAMLAKEWNDARVLAEAERIRSTLLSSISHDLRTPLTSITGAASTLREGGGNQMELAETIYSESIRLNHQIQNLLDMTRLQSGQIKLDEQWHSVYELLETSVRRTKSSLGDRQVELKVPLDIQLIRVDGLLIEKALTNLLENVGRYTGPTDRLYIDCQVEGENLSIVLRDTGPGIRPESLKVLFTPSYRTPSGGYGLGLAVVKAVMDLHNGTVVAGNAAIGGAEFRLTLPIPKDQPAVIRG
jgi:two-component system sensor histidine kinase KdpD